MKLLLPVLLIFASWTAGAQTPSSDPDRSLPPIPAAPQLAAESYVLMDFNSGQMLVEHNPDMRVAPASITKLMTAYVVFHGLAEGTLKLEDAVPVSEKAWRTGGSRMFIEPSMQVTIEDLVRGTVIQSGNDASVALAEHVAGSEDAFVDLMNHYGAQLGMQGTHYTNSTGLPDPEHYTTARDVALLSAATIRDFPDYYAWYSEKEFTFNNIRQHNRNTLLWRDPAIDGLKTGHTESAGYCLAASAKRNGMRLVSALMGSASESSRASETQSLLNYGFRFFETVQLYEGGQELTRARVWKGLEDQVPLGLQQALFVTIPVGRYDDLEAQLHLQPQLMAPLDAGATLGRISIALDDELVASRDLVALSAVEQAGFFSSALDGLQLWFEGFFEDEPAEPGSG